MVSEYVSLGGHVDYEFPTGGCYKIDNGLHFSGAQDVTISSYGDGDPTKFWQPDYGTGTVPIFAFGNRGSTPSSDITVENIDIVGPNTTDANHGSDADEWGAGIDASGVNGITITNVSISDVAGDCVTFAPSVSTSPLFPTRNASFLYSTCTNTGRQGVAFSGTDGADIEWITLSGVSLNPFDLEPRSTNVPAQNITIKHTTSSGGVIWLSAEGQNNHIGNIDVENNKMTSKPGDQTIDADGHASDPAGPLYFANNALLGATSHGVNGVEANTTTSLTFTNNTLAFPVSTPEHGARVLYSIHATVTNNVFTNAALASGTSNCSWEVPTQSVCSDTYTVTNGGTASGNKP